MFTALASEVNTYAFPVSTDALVRKLAVLRSAWPEKAMAYREVCAGRRGTVNRSSGTTNSLFIWLLLMAYVRGGAAYEWLRCPADAGFTIVESETWLQRMLPGAAGPRPLRLSRFPALAQPSHGLAQAHR